MKSVETATPPRKCCRCGATKALEEFPRNRSKKLGRSYDCNVCHRKSGRAYQRARAAREGEYQSTRWRRENGRRGLTYTVTCEHCGQEGRVTKRDARYCTSACARRAQSAAAHSRYLPVLHPDPAPVTDLPPRHPAMLPARRRTEWWKLLVAGPCAWCSESFVAVAATFETRSLYCSKRCQRNAAEALRGRFRVPPRVRLAIYERDGWTCQLCSEVVDPDLPPSDPWGATLDHVVPQSWTLVPDHSPGNLRLAHRWCNSVRSDERHHTAGALAVA